MQAMTLRICHLYPTLLSIAGDRGNLMAIQQRCVWRGLDTEVTEIAVGDHADFTSFDLILFHGGQDKEMDVAARDLAGKASSLRDAAASDVVMLAVCAGYQLLGHYYQPYQGSGSGRCGSFGHSHRGWQHTVHESSGYGVRFCSWWTPEIGGL